MMADEYFLSNPGINSRRALGAKEEPMFEVVTDPANIAKLNSKLAKIMRRAFPYKESRELTYPAGHHTGNVYFEENRGQRVRGWSPLDHDPAKHVNHLLFGTPGEVGWLEMAVQLNFPKESYDRSYAGAFVRDASGVIFLAHRGKLTKGKAGLRKSLVLSQFSTCIEARDGNQMNRMILIAGLEQPDMIDKLFAFAQEARDVATRIAAGGVVESGSEEKGSGGSGSDKTQGKDTAADRDSMLGLSEYFDEFSGETNVTPSDFIGTRVVEHGAIVAALAKALGSGNNLRKSQAIDLAAICKDTIHLFEVKTSASTQNVYTAVGQLLIHGEGIEARLKKPVRRFLVLPEMPRKDLLPPIATALEGAIIIYRSERGVYTFTELPRIHGEPAQAPVGEPRGLVKK